MSTNGTDDSRKRYLIWISAVSLIFCTLTCQGALCPDTDRELPTTVPELATLVHEELDTSCAPLDAIEALGNMGTEAAPAVPALVPALRHHDLDTVSTTAQTLSKIGPGAAPAVPVLIELVRNGPKSDDLEGWYPYWDIIIALGNIGTSARPAIPVLADALNGVGSTDAAWAIAQITEQDWTDANVVMICADDNSRFSIDENRIPFIVTAAQEWWESEGQYQKWPDSNVDE